MALAPWARIEINADVRRFTTQLPVPGLLTWGEEKATPLFT
jgi:hypothetical protein